jgi:hypothetical protein
MTSTANICIKINKINRNINGTEKEKYFILKLNVLCFVPIYYCQLHICLNIRTDVLVNVYWNKVFGFLFWISLSEIWINMVCYYNNELTPGKVLGKFALSQEVFIRFVIFVYPSVHIYQQDPPPTTPGWISVKFNIGKF